MLCCCGLTLYKFGFEWQLKLQLCLWQILLSDVTDPLWIPLDWDSICHLQLIQITVHLSSELLVEIVYSAKS